MLLWDYRLNADAFYYYETALNVAQGRGFVLPDGRLLGAVPPAFPCLLAVVFKTVGPSIRAAQLTQVLISAVTAPLLYTVARLYFNERAAFLAAAAFVIHPAFIWTGVVVLTEGLATLCLAAAAMFFYYAAQGKRWAAPLVGFVGAAGALAKSALFAVGVWYVAALPWVMKGTRRHKAYALLLAGLAFTVPVAAWTARNWDVLGRPVPLTLNAYQLFYEGNCGPAGAPPVPALLHSAAYETAVYGPAPQPNADLAAEAFFRERARDVWRRAWPRVVAAWPAKLVVFLRPAPALGGLGGTAASAVGGVVLVLGWAGALYYRRDLLPAIALGGPFLITVAVHVALKPFFRFRLPVEFILITYGAAFFTWLTRRRAACGRPPAPVNI